MSSGTEERFYNYYKDKILSLLRRLAQQAKTKEQICNELRMLKRTIGALGGAQLSKEKKEELKQMIDEALRVGGCK